MDYHPNDSLRPDLTPRTDFQPLILKENDGYKIFPLISYKVSYKLSIYIVKYS